MRDPAGDRSATRTAYLALTGMAIGFGGTWVAGSWAADEIPAFTVAATRFAIASLLLLGWTGVARRRLAPVRAGSRLRRPWA